MSGSARRRSSRRTRSTARRWTNVSSQVLAFARSGLKRSAVRQAVRNPSCTASSASFSSRSTRSASPYATRPNRSYSSASADSSERATSATTASSERWANDLGIVRYSRIGPNRFSSSCEPVPDMQANTPERSDRTMRKLAFVLLAAAASAALVTAFASRGGSPSAAQASSHREAPLISEDPSADNTDTYAFRSPDRPDTVSIISNYIPGEDPAAGPNWYTFSPSARYVVYADKNGDGKPDVTWRFRFKNRAPVAFLQNTQQEYTVTRVEGNSSRVIGSGLLTPPDNIGPRSTPNYHSLAMAGVHDLNDGAKVFAGQRDDGFFGDIGAAFDLVAIRNGTGATGGGKDFFAGFAVHAISLQVPLSQLDNGGNHIVGIWSATDRPKVSVTVKGEKVRRKTTWVQVSRLGNPLINELLIPTQLKDKWND